ncbi:ORF6N domain-containing protein [Rhizobium sp. Leaf391]|uniref:ORF6N domain-containing protein n=1 Tax=Rhizobium sp. Leaf391 TaxID=1736360 RepID=UPI0009EB3750|nr:ORF6N domain-containing protein [Rhizobium sp. Leaf391]
MDSQSSSTLMPTVSIGGVDVKRITYRGEPIVTMSQVDEIHQRPDDTARRTFNENRDRFVEGADFHSLTSDEIRTMSQLGIFPSRTARANVLTERGYLKLTKPMNDDRAWEVQGDMVDVYFAAQEGAIDVSRLPLSKKLKTVGDVMHGFSRLAGLLGLKGNQRALSAAMATQRETGVNVLELTGVTHLKADISQQFINSTSVGERTDPTKTENEVNLILEKLGLQAAHRIPGKRPGKMRIAYWDLTDAGRAAGGDIFDTGKKDFKGRPVKQIMWPTSVIALVQRQLTETLL